MKTAPEVSPSTPAQEQPEEKAEEKKEEEKSPYKFKFHPDDFSIDIMLTHGFVRGTILFNDKFKATYRSLCLDDCQQCERVIDPERDKGKSLKFLNNELTIKQVYFALESINGQTLPPPPPKTEKGEEQEDARDRKIRALPGQMFDLLVQGLNDFEARCNVLVSKGAIENF